MKKGQWKTLAARSRFLPVLMGKPRVRDAGYDVELVDGLSRWVYCAGMLPVAAACGAYVVYALLSGEQSVDLIGMIIAGTICLGAGGAGLYLALRVNQIRCIGGGGGLRLTRGVLLWNGTVTLKPDEAGACIRLLENEDTLSGTRAGHAALALLRGNEKARSIRIAVHSAHSALWRPFQKMKEALGGRGVDGTVTEVTLRDGEKLRVSRACRGGTLLAGAPGMGVMQVSGKGRMKTASIWKSNIGGGIVLALAACSVFYAIRGGFDLPPGWRWVAYAVGGIFLVGAAALLAGFGSHSMTIDLGRDLLLAGRRGFGVRQYAVRDVAAVQVCSRWLGRYPHPVWSWRRETVYTYQIFLILRGDTPRRLFVQSTTHRDGVFYDARRLANLLDRPLLDHTVDESE